MPKSESSLLDSSVSLSLLLSSAVSKILSTDIIMTYSQAYHIYTAEAEKSAVLNISHRYFRPFGTLKVTYEFSAR